MDNNDHKTDEICMSDVNCDSSDPIVVDVTDRRRHSCGVQFDYNDRTLAKQFRKCCGTCCGACGKCCSGCSLALVITSNVVISLGILIALLFLVVTVKSIANRLDQDTGDDHGVTCFDELGCFPKVYGCMIPTVTTPMSPNELGVNFRLFTGDSNSTFADKVDDIHIEMCDFDPKLETKVIIHGFKNGYTEKNWMGRLKNLILKNGNYNVIAVDWSKGANVPKYWKAAASTDVVGAIVANFIRKLVDIKGADVQTFHIIGHSLGAHISGAVGNFFPFPKINLITGLDPAGPCFFKFITTPRKPSEYLDMDDANVVQTIHTNGQELGFIIDRQLSHYEFYPNGGKRQPGCQSAFTITSLGVAIENGSAFAPTLSCSHGYAHELISFDYTSLNHSCQPVAYNCQNYESYVSGSCSYDRTHDKSQIMALAVQYSGEQFLVRVPERTMKFYAQTSASEPYCMYQYVVYMQTSQNSPYSVGVIDILLRGLVDHSVRLERNFYPNQEYKQFTSFEAKDGPLGAIRQIEISFESSAANNAIAVDRVMVQSLGSMSMSDDYLCSPVSPTNINKQKTTIMCRRV